MHRIPLGPKVLACLMLVYTFCLLPQANARLPEKPASASAPRQAADKGTGNLWALADADGLDVYLLTADLGHVPAARFGHTAIRLQHHEANLDVAVSWGHFQFTGVEFIWDYLRGRAHYLMTIVPFLAFVDHYATANQTLWQDRINLTGAQKRDLLKRLRANSRPGRRAFRYQHWVQNCSTRPRDHLNAVIQGSLRDQLDNRLTAVRYRDAILGPAARFPMFATFFSSMMNSGADRSLSSWEAMYLPLDLRKQLQTANAVSDQGDVLADVPLLMEAHTLVGGTISRHDRFPDWLVLAVLGWLPMVWFLVQLLRAKPQAATGNVSGRGWRGFGLALIVWGAFSSVFGGLMIANWVLNADSLTWANANLWQFNPLDLVFVLFGIKIWRARGPVVDRIILPGVGKAIAYLSVVGWIGLGVASWLGAVVQDVTLAWWLIGLPKTVALVLCVSFGWRRAPAGELAPQAAQPAAAGQSLPHQS